MGSRGNNQPHGCVGPCVPTQSYTHSQVLTPLQEAKRLGGFLNSEGKMFHKAGPVEEKAVFLDTASRNPLIDEVCSMAYLPEQWNRLMWWGKAGSVVACLSHIRMHTHFFLLSFVSTVVVFCNEIFYLSHQSINVPEEKLFPVYLPNPCVSIRLGIN